LGFDPSWDSFVHPKESAMPLPLSRPKSAKSFSRNRHSTPAEIRKSEVAEQARQITVAADPDALAEVCKLDGCYVLKTDLTAPQCAKEVVHARYKDLARVEWAFRTSKTVELEMRPLYLRLAERTRAHALVVMLAYRIVQELAERWGTENLTVQEGLQELATLCAMEVRIRGEAACCQIPKPRPTLQRLFDLARVPVPAALPCKGIAVATRKHLATRRKTC